MQVLGLKSNSSSILHQLSDKPRKQTVDEIIESVTKTIAEEPVSTWKQSLDYADYEQNYHRIFGVIVTNIANLMFDQETTRYVIGFASSHLIP